MELSEIQTHLEGIPYLRPDYGQRLYQFVLDTKPEECLELGFAHGVSSCYIAAALDELGRGHLTTVDLDKSRKLKPTIEGLLDATRLGRYVSVVREMSSYTWFLKGKIEEQTSEGICVPLYDFCFVDGSKNWTVEACAFFCTDKLLKSGGWILYDDFSWKYANAIRRGKKVSDGVLLRSMDEDQLTTPNIELVFRLLVMQHPSYGAFRIEEGKFAYARKLPWRTSETPAGNGQRDG